MNIIYLTWGETPRSYGVFASQVIGQFVENSKQTKDNNYFFISAVPIVHSGLVRDKFGYFKEIEMVKKQLGSIPFIRIPIYVTQNFVNSSKATFKYMHIGVYRHLKNKFLEIKPEMVHCRSYHAAWAALKVKEKYGFNYKIIFDGRGLWPEEVSLKKGFKKDSKNYLFLKNIEKELLLKCDVSVAVSDTMKEHYKNLGANRVECIYLSASTQKLLPKQSQTTSKKKDTVFCYVGALSKDTWHQPLQLLELYRHLRNVVDNPKLIIVTTSNHEVIKEVFSEIPNEELTFTSTKSIDELSEVLSLADFGVLSYFKPKTTEEKLLGSMVLAVKTAEYLSAGLPVIVNSYCGGAAKIVENYHLGISYNPNSFEELTKKSIVSIKNKYTKFEINEKAKELFDYKVHAKEYVKLYEKK